MRRPAALLLLTLLAACGRGGTPSAAAPSAVPEILAAAPRIMSLNPCLDAILLRVADPGQIVSISHLSQDPAASSIEADDARRFAINHGTAEEVLVDRPDIVLLEPHVAAPTQAAIRAAGIRIAPVAVPNTIAQSIEQIRAIARVAGHPRRGEALVARIETALSAARPAADERPLPVIIRMPDGLVPGTGTLADELLVRTGFRNLSADYGLSAWDILPLEPLIAGPPAILFTDRSRPAGRNAVLERLPGLLVADFPDRLLQCAGPNLIEAADRLAAVRRRHARS